MEYDSKNRTLFLNVTFFSKKQSKKSTLFQKNDSKNWTFFLVWLKEFNLFEHDSMNWTFFNMSRRIEPFFLEYDAIEPFSIMTQRNELLFLWYEWLHELYFSYKKKLNELNFFLIWLKEVFFLNRTDRIYFFKIWLKEFNLFLLRNMTQTIEPCVKKKRLREWNSQKK